MNRYLSAPFRILGVAAVCILALVALVANEARARAGGTEVIMAMQPVDPRSLLSGHYVIVSLQEQLPLGAPCPETIGEGGAFGPWSVDGSGWVALAPNGDVHSAVGVAETREGAAALGPIVARGSAHCFMPTETAPEEGQPEPAPQRANAFADLGVDRFYIDQDNAERIERIMRDSANAEEAQVFAILSVGSDGRARMKGLLVEGERFELELF